jgi:hypothetical protein
VVEIPGEAAVGERASEAGRGQRKLLKRTGRGSTWSPGSTGRASSAIGESTSDAPRWIPSNVPATQCPLLRSIEDGPGSHRASLNEVTPGELTAKTIAPRRPLKRSDSVFSLPASSGGPYRPASCAVPQPDSAESLPSWNRTRTKPRRPDRPSGRGLLAGVGFWVSSPRPPNALEALARAKTEGFHRRPGKSPWRSQIRGYYSTVRQAGSSFRDPTQLADGPRNRSFSASPSPFPPSAPGLAPGVFRCRRDTRLLRRPMALRSPIPGRGFAPRRLRSPQRPVEQRDRTESPLHVGSVKPHPRPAKCRQVPPNRCPAESPSGSAPVDASRSTPSPDRFGSAITAV